jgi:hypothetical protein
MLAAQAEPLAEREEACGDEHDLGDGVPRASFVTPPATRAASAATQAAPDADRRELASELVQVGSHTSTAATARENVFHSSRLTASASPPGPRPSCLARL